MYKRQTFDIVQRKLKSRQRPRQTGEISLFAGLLKCGEWGKSLTIRYTNDKHPKQIYSCKTYNAYGKQHCTQHRVESVSYTHLDVYKRQVFTCGFHTNIMAVIVKKPLLEFKN